MDALAIPGLLAPPIGIAIGLLLSYRVLRSLGDSRLGRGFSSRGALKTAKIGALIFGILSVPVAIVLAFFVGAYVGGGFGALLGKVGTVIGLGLGAGLMTFLVSACSTIVGFLLFGWLRQLS